MTEAIVTQEHPYYMPYSVGLRVPADHELLFIAGLNALPLYHDHPHKLEELEFPPQAGAQTRAILEAMVEVLGGAGATLADVVRLDIFVTDMALQGEVVREIGAAFSGSQPPAMSLLGIGELVVPGLLVEINGIAAIKPS